MHYKDLYNLLLNGDLNSVTADEVLNARDKYGRSILLAVTKSGELSYCKKILKKCPSLLYIQDDSNSKFTVLHQATYNGNYELLDYFLSVGLEAATNEGNMESKEENMRRFKKWIKLKNYKEDTALTMATFKQDLRMVKRLIEVDREYKLGLSGTVGPDSQTALQLAVENEDDEIIKLLTDKGDPSISTTQAQESQHTGNSSDSAGYRLDSIVTSQDIKLKSHATVASKHKMLTLAEISKHNNSKDCWLVIGGEVYDVTRFLGDHPGGGEILLKASGKDATNDFEEVHSHSNNAMAMMDEFYVGVYDKINSLLTKLASDKPQQYSHEQLVDFTDDFSHSLGSGGFGDVYKGKLPNGVLIAVKVLKDINGKDKIMEEQFAAEVNTMGRTYHRNLIRLYGYCYDANTKFKALIYDYMESGSLKTVLFEKKLDLPWERLNNIAKEIAQGISYLHESCQPQIIHQDIKPDNVLLDSNFSPKVTDFGLAKVNMGESQFDQSKVKGTCNYMAPEVNQPDQVKLSCKCDVYSFGMVLFDILGSKRNHVDKRFWFPGQVWDKFRKEQLDKFIVDCGIEEEDKDNAKRLSTIALLCAEQDPKRRPKMSNVVKMLEGEIKQLETPVDPFYHNYQSPSEGRSASHDSRDDY